jgi:hypothetical protein
MSQKERFNILKETADKQFRNLVNNQKNIEELEKLNRKKLN